MDAQLSMLPIQQAITLALKGNSSFTSLCPNGGPFDPAPESTVFPYVTFGEHSETPMNPFQGFGSDVLVLLHVWSQSTSFYEALTIANVLVGALSGKSLSLSDGGAVALLFDWSTKLEDPDGKTRHVPVRFQAWTVQNASP